MATNSTEVPMERKRRIARGILAFLIVLALSAGSWVLTASGDALSILFRNGSFKGAPDRPGWTIFESSGDGWKVQFPSSWYARRIEDVRRGFPYTSEVRSIAITNVDHELTRVRCGPRCWSPWIENVGLPADGILMQIGWNYGGGFTCTLKHSTARPLSLTYATRETKREGAGGTPQVRFAVNFSDGKMRHNLTAWVGSRATAADLKILEQIVASVSYRSQLPAVPLGEQNRIREC